MFPWTAQAKLSPFIGNEISTELWSLIYKEATLILASEFLAGVAFITSGILLLKSNKVGAHLWLVSLVAFIVTSGYIAYTKNPDLIIVFLTLIFSLIGLLFSYLVFRVCGIYIKPSPVKS